MASIDASKLITVAIPASQMQQCVYQRGVFETCEENMTARTEDSGNHAVEKLEAVSPSHDAV